MHIEIVPYTSEHEAAVRSFNGRMAAAQLDRNLYSTSFPDSHIPKWLPKREGCGLFQEFFVAVDDQSAIRGGYILKHQPFLLNGDPLDLVTYQLPISEGIVDLGYAFVGVRLYRDAIRRNSRLLGVGGGGLQSPIGEFLLAAGWRTTPVSFWFGVVHPNRFLRNIAILQPSLPRRMISAALRYSGLGWLGIKAGFALRGVCRLPDSVTYETVPEFSDWTDDIWNRCGRDYSLIAVRDQTILNILYPATDPRFIRLKISKDGLAIGWALLLNTQMSGSPYFGEMRVGTLVDCLAKPQDADYVVACARVFLEANNSDLIISNQASHAWKQALRNNGFFQRPSNFPFFASPKLTSLLQPFEHSAASFHLNRGDGDGPIHL